jgi:translocation and assembly module TamA
MALTPNPMVHHKAGGGLRHAAVSLCLIACLALSGPASAFELFGIHLFGERKSQEALREPVPDPVAYTAAMTVKSSTALDETLRAASELLNKQNEPPSGTIGLLSRAQSDHQQLIATLYQAGHYGGIVAIRIGGRPYQQIPIGDALARAGPVSVAINVDPGPVFTFGRVDILSAGDGASSAAALGLSAGEPARSGLILEAENRLIEDWRKRGFPHVRIKDRTITADHATHRLDVVIAVETGRAATFGTVTVTGTERMDADFVAWQAGIPAGRVYSPEIIKAAAKRLRALEVFDTVVISEAEMLAADGTLPISIEVGERKRRVIGIGATASNTEGFGAEAFWAHRNLFGRAERFRIEGAVNRIGDASGVDDLDYHAAITFAKPGVLGPATTLTAGLAADQENPDAFSKRAVSGEIGLTRIFTDQLTGSAGLEVEWSKTTDVFGANTNLLIGAPLALVFDSRDSTLNPTEGFRATVMAEPIYDAQNSNAFFIAQGSLASYLSLSDADRLVLAARVAAGSIVGASLAAIPSDRRFYAGGGGSIRGYAFQAASPRTPAGVLTGGRSFAEASLEARIAITDTIGIVPFIDVGGAFTGTIPGSGGTFFAGAGVGLRYLTPVGPLRLDVAVPLKTISGEPDYGIYVGFGQAF